jgi:hypothetical protein
VTTTFLFLSTILVVVQQRDSSVTTTISCTTTTREFQEHIYCSSSECDSSVTTTTSCTTTTSFFQDVPIPLSNGAPGSCRHDVCGRGDFHVWRIALSYCYTINEIKAKVYVTIAGPATTRGTMTEPFGVP